MMTRKICVVAVALMATMLLTTNVLAANNCSGGINPVFIGVGSSAQTNTLAYAGVNITSNGTFAGYSLWTSGSGRLQDTRFSPAVVDTGLTVWVTWVDNATNPTTCDFYAYYQEDSTVGVRDFFAVAKSVSPGKGTYHPVFGEDSTSWLEAAGANKIPGLADAGGNLPSPIATYLKTSPAPTSATQVVPAYCGQLGALGTATLYCYFNAGATDIRPEDALFATTRALSAYSTTNGLSGLGYAQVGSSGCGAVSANQGCSFADSFGQGKSFSVLNFHITGTDPVTLGTVPKYSTMTTGMAPIVVFVSNNDTSTSTSFGKKYTDSHGASHYTFHNINRETLADVFSGTTECTGALLAGTPASGNNEYDTGAVAGPPAGAGQPIQVVFREALSGTYNTFEFNAVRTMYGSQTATVKENTVTSSQWLSNNQAGQELDINPALNFGDANCNAATAPNGSTQCGIPTFISSPSHPGTTQSACPGSGQLKPIRVRAVGSGNLVSATLGSFNSVTTALSPGWKVSNGIGYAFWSYPNFKGANATGSTPGHYLTVDSIDPLFITAGGEFDSAYGQLNNPAGAFNAPQCPTFPCQQLPFAHIFDGTYPIWSQLRLVTMANVSGKQQTPAGVINMVAFSQIEAVDNRFNSSDFVPILKNISGVPYVQGGTLPTGDLNIGVFRSHYKQSAVNPFNGHATTASCPAGFVGISIKGGTGGAATGTCLVDVGGDVGGSVTTVQADVDFNLDAGTVVTKEVYAKHQ